MIALTCGLLISISLYMILEDSSIRKIFGLVLLSTTINIILLYCGRLTHNKPAFLTGVVSGNLSNAVPQALILTAIVIGFGLLVFLCVLMKRLNKP